MKGEFGESWEIDQIITEKSIEDLCWNLYDASGGTEPFTINPLGRPVVAFVIVCFYCNLSRKKNHVDHIG